MWALDVSKWNFFLCSVIGWHIGLCKVVSKAMKRNENQNGEGTKQTMNNMVGREQSVRETLRRLAQKEWMRKAVAKIDAEDWWKKSSLGQKTLAMTLAQMMEELTETKRIEVRRESGSLRARFIYLLKQPEPGCLSAIMLPAAEEVDHRGRGTSHAALRPALRDGRGR